MEEFYDMLFKRKSMRTFAEGLTISEKEMQAIRQQIDVLVPLEKDIRVRFKIVKREETTARFGEYCLLMYSEQNAHYLLNAGYMLEQMDLFFAAQNIGACWVGLAKPKEKQYDGLEYVIMIAFGKSRPQDFRQDIAECNRKEAEMIWEGEFYRDIADVVHYAPSACNSQPWRVVSGDHRIQVYRNTVIKSFIPAKKLPYFNSIDMGIFLCFLEITLQHNQYSFNRKLCGEQDPDKRKIKIAEYHLL
jgi:hypothetical protein